MSQAFEPLVLADLPHLYATLAERCLQDAYTRIAWKLMVTGDNYAKKSAPATLAGTA